MPPTTDGPNVDDRHIESLDIRSILDGASLVVASVEGDPRTSRTAPDWLDTVVCTDRGRNAARNVAVQRAENDWIVLADEDITFPTTLTAVLVDSMHTRQLVGLADVWPTRWILTRYMIFHRSVWEAVGGFDESREHGGDTDFAIRAEKAGIEILRLPSRIVPHHDTESEFTTSEHLEWLCYMMWRHPRQILPVAATLLLSKIGLVDRSRHEYPDDWAGQIWAASEPPAREK